MTIFGDGEQTRTIVHVDDVVKALVMAIEWPVGEYQLGGEVLSINQIADKIGKPKVYEPNYTGNIFASVIENTTPNWTPTICL
jgi:nucleoside-diphosphate-sugar epimerase